MYNTYRSLPFVSFSQGTDLTGGYIQESGYMFLFNLFSHKPFKDVYSFYLFCTHSNYPFHWFSSLIGNGSNPSRVNPKSGSFYIAIIGSYHFALTRPN